MFHLVKLEKADFYLSEHSAFNQNIQMDRRVQLYSLQKQALQVQPTSSLLARSRHSRDVRILDFTCCHCAICGRQRTGSGDV
jgi:hypothetical protein